jgi:hypothetical protein
MYNEWGEEDERKHNERNHQEEEDIGGWIILRWIIERLDGEVWTGLSWLRVGTAGKLL